MAAKTMVIATTNQGKVRELEHMFRAVSAYALVGLNASDPRLPHVDEVGATYLENAILKAKAYAKYLRQSVLADDSGLEVDALNGAPGVHSARYAGAGATDEQNRQKLLRALAEMDAPQRTARFRCVLVLIDPAHSLDEPLHVAEGTCEGFIAPRSQGEQGFGYDPIFIPDEPWNRDAQRTMAELDPAIKNQLSHRGRAAHALLQWLSRTPAAR
jgi:XTP/dITP diphosphohydrolase